MLAQNLFNKKNINDPFINKKVNVFVKPARCIYLSCKSTLFAIPKMK